MAFFLISFIFLCTDFDVKKEHSVLLKNTFFRISIVCCKFADNILKIVLLLPLKLGKSLDILINIQEKLKIFSKIKWFWVRFKKEIVVIAKNIYFFVRYDLNSWMIQLNKNSDEVY